MRLYSIKAATPIRVDYGTELCAGMRAFPEIAGYEPAFASINQGVRDAYEDRRATRQPLLVTRFELRFGAYQARQALRAAASAAEAADGGRRGAIFEVVFPDGLGPVVAPKGAMLAPPLEKVINDLSQSTLPSIDAYRNAWLPRLQAALDLLKQRAAAADAARKAYVTAFRKELVLRREHRKAVERVMGFVRAEFPGDKAKQDLVFPEVDAEDDAEPAEEGETPAPKPA
ncbi:MAG: hypothetical protein QM820_37790 [Minicystis sp.]